MNILYIVIGLVIGGIISIIGYINTRIDFYMYLSFLFLFISIWILVINYLKILKKNKIYLNTIESMDELYYLEIKKYEDKYNEYKESVDELRNSVLDLINSIRKIQNRYKKALEFIFVFQKRLLLKYHDFSNINCKKEINTIDEEHDKIISSILDLKNDVIKLSKKYNSLEFINIESKYKDIKSIINILITLAHESNNGKIIDLVKKLENKLIPIYEEILDFNIEYKKIEDAKNNDIKNIINDVDMIYHLNIDLYDKVLSLENRLKNIYSELLSWFKNTVFDIDLFIKDNFKKEDLINAERSN